MSIEIKAIEKNEVTELKRLFERTPILAKNNPFINGSIDEFIWQFFSDNYHSSAYIVAHDTDKDELAGTLSALYIQMKAPDGQVYQTIKPEDTLINIKTLVRHKNRDLLKELFDEIESKSKLLNIKFFWGFTYAINSFERLGFTRHFSSRQGTYVIKPSASYRHLISLNTSNGTKQKIQIAGLTMLSYLKQLLSQKSHSELKCKEIRLKDINEDILLSFLPDHLYSIYVDKFFLDWRIEENISSLTYSILQIDDHSNQIKAYLIYSQKEGKVFFIEQLLFDRKLSIRTKAAIFQVALKYLKSLDAVIVRAMGFNHNQANKEDMDLLIKSGFTFINRGIPFIFKSMDENIKAEDIYLSRLNTDGTF
ncbi:MAG: hypothetical protein GZ091_15245 [Paludibacter sp.]|nr:hypothetical protein [Paludibacter sp.]